MKNLTRRTPPRAVTNCHGFTRQAPLVSRNAVNGNGGGMMPRAATMNAGLLFTRCSTRRRVEGLSRRASPASPTFRPIQNVSDAPVMDPTAASTAYIQNRSGLRGQDDDHEVDPERQEEHHGGVERPHEEQT